MYRNNKRFTAVVLCVAVFIVAFCACTSNLRKDGDVYSKTLRLHVLANSDSEYDQRMKLAVKDAVIVYISEAMNECTTKEEAESYILSHSDAIESVARDVVAEFGASHAVELTLTKEYYPRRTYGDVTLPAGEYSSVRILLGEAEGQNWWCVLFPQVCTDTATPSEERLAQAGFTSAQIRLLTEQEKPVYKIKFKLVELFARFTGDD